MAMIGCEKIRVRLDDWLDGRLAGEALGEVNDHLAFCEDCRRLFDTHLSLAENLASLGRAAEKIAGHEGPIIERGRPWLRRIVAIAACFALAIGGVYYVGLSHIDIVPPFVEPDAPLATAIEFPAVPLGDLMVRPVDERQVRIENAPDCIALNVESSNPRVHIVWLYGSCAGETKTNQQ